MDICEQLHGLNLELSEILYICVHPCFDDFQIGISPLQFELPKNINLVLDRRDKQGRYEDESRGTEGLHQDQTTIFYFFGLVFNIIFKSTGIFIGERKPRLDHYATSPLYLIYLFHFCFMLYGSLLCHSAQGGWKTGKGWGINNKLGFSSE